MERIKIISHSQKEIIYIDYSNLETENEMQIIRDKATDFIINYSKPSLQILNFKNCFITPDFFRTAKNVGKKLSELTEYCAIVGTDGAKKLLFKRFCRYFQERKLELFEDEYQALEWLTTIEKLSVYTL